MYEEIIVPLDMSSTSEIALPHAIAVARAFGSRVTLLFANEPLTVLPEPTIGGPMITVLPEPEDELDAAKEYLEKKVGDLTIQGVSARMEILEGSPAYEIGQYIKDHSVDLIVMTTHGRTGLLKFMYGSVASSLLQEITIPILLVRVCGDEKCPAPQGGGS
jgi:nucleotide-binding universal stress UspA family protein